MRQEKKKIKMNLKKKQQKKQFMQLKARGAANQLFQLGFELFFSFVVVNDLVVDVLTEG